MVLKSTTDYYQSYYSYWLVISQFDWPLNLIVFIQSLITQTQLNPMFLLEVISGINSQFFKSLETLK